MGLFDAFSGGAGGDIEGGYDQANQYLQPYQQGGQQAYNKYNNYVDQFGNNLAPYANAGNYQYSQINQSPMDYYSNIMNSYSESPEAQYALKNAEKAATYAGSASGMTGSGAFYKGIQQNANDIMMNDRNNYYNNVMGANTAQMGALQNLQGQQAQYNQMQQYLTNLGYGAATGMGQNAINNGLAQAQQDENGMADLMQIGGTAAGYYFGGPMGGAAAGAMLGHK